ncbi:MAG: hypothetical protein IKR39_03850 [Lachnospiraceae bacterium]|nr:hypothetical protein [Lachnospiraceae bacterium]
MKLLKKLTTMILGAALLCTMVMVPKIEAHADGPVTWYITYNGGKWFGSNNTINWWTDAGIVASGMKDGDHIVVNADNQTSELFSLTVDKRIGDLVATNGAVCNITAPYAERVYVAGKGSTLIATVGLANNVEVWPGQTIQVVGDVTNFLAHYDYSGPEYPIFGVSGSVKAANVNYTGSVDSSFHTIYGIAPGLFTSNNNGIVTLKEGQFSLVPVETPVTGTTTQNSTPAKKQLDKVPQTGAFASKETIAFLMLAAVFGAAALATASVVKKRA